MADHRLARHWCDSWSFAHLLHPRARSNTRLVPAIEWLAVVGGVVSVSGLHLLHNIHALQNTTVANTLFVLSAAPLATAVLARIFLDERVSRATWIAMFVALLGIVVMVGGGVVSGTGFGNLMALGSMFCFSAFVVVLRRGRAVNMLPVVVLSWVVSLIAGIGMAGGDLSVPLSDALFVLLWGGVVSSVMYCLFTYGSRHVTGAEVTLLVQLEFVLGPLWVWLFVDEEPSRFTLLGGLTVLAAVVGRGLAMARQKPR